MQTKQRWYVSLFTVLAAVALIWCLSEQTTARGKPASLLASERW
jgi:hypothetical protein